MYHWHGLLSFLLERARDYQFVFKFFAWCLNKYCLSSFLTGLQNNNLPVYLVNQKILFYFAIPGVDLVLTGLIILHLLDQEPQVWIQRLLVGAAFSIILMTGTMGVYNCVCQGTFPYHMLTMSLILVVMSFLLIFDFIGHEEFFSEKLDFHLRRRDT